MPLKKKGKKSRTRYISGQSDWSQSKPKHGAHHVRHGVVTLLWTGNVSYPYDDEEMEVIDVCTGVFVHLYISKFKKKYTDNYTNRGGLRGTLTTAHTLQTM